MCRIGEGSVTTGAIAEAIECSVFVNPRELGLTYEEIKEVGARAGFKEGEIGDAYVTVGLYPTLPYNREILVPVIENVPAT